MPFAWFAWAEVRIPTPTSHEAADRKTVDWRRGQRKAEEIDILRMFADDPAAPYAIHNFVNHGSSKCGKYPGEWFGPSATSQCIKYVPKQERKAGTNKLYVKGPNQYSRDEYASLYDRR